jgi:hypothetical protein
MSALLRRFVLTLLPPLFAVSLFVGVPVTFVVVDTAIDSHVEIEQFEADIRHYTDKMVVENGTFAFKQASHPLLQFVGIAGASWFIAAGTFYASVCLRRQGRRKPQE